MECPTHLFTLLRLMKHTVSDVKLEIAPEFKKNIYTQGVENIKHYISNDMFEFSPQLENRKKYIQANLF